MRVCKMKIINDFNNQNLRLNIFYGRFSRKWQKVFYIN